MPFEDFDDGRRFWDAWRAVTVERRVEYALFTFGQTELPYYLVMQPGRAGETVTVRRGEVTVDRAQIITPWSEQPEFRDFFDDPEDEDLIEFLVARTAAFSNLRLANRRGAEQIVSDSVEEAVARLNRQLDDEEEDRVAILSAPKRLAGVAVLRYTTERIMASTPSNLQELRERGLLP